MVNHVFSWHGDRYVCPIDSTNATIEVRKELRVLQSLMHISAIKKKQFYPAYPYSTNETNKSISVFISKVEQVFFSDSSSTQQKIQRAM